MIRKNTLSVFEYIGEYFFFTAILVFNYRQSLFVAIKNVSYSSSKILLWIFIGVFGILNMVLTLRSRRNLLNLIVIIIMPFTVYGCLSLAPYAGIRVLLTELVSLIIVAIYLILMFSLYDRGIKNMFIQAFIGVKDIIVIVAFLIILLPSWISLFWGYNMIYVPTANEQTIISTTSEWTIDGQKGYIKENISKCENKNLTEEEKVETIKSLADIIVRIEYQNLGLSEEPANVQFSGSDETLLAYYKNGANTITISLNHIDEYIDDPYYLIEVMTHEVYHAYEKELIENYEKIVSAKDEVNYNLFAFKRILRYKKEFYKYDNYDEFEQIFTQVEIDADKYADLRKRQYKTNLK